METIRTYRAPVGKTGTITRDQATCLIANVSKSGAALEIIGSTGVPDAFTLTIDGDPVARPARVRWRTATGTGVRVGVEFQDDRRNDELRK